VHERKQGRFRNGNWHERARARARERIWFANLGKFPTLPRGVLPCFPLVLARRCTAASFIARASLLQDALRIPRRHAAEKRRAVAWILISPRLVASRAMYSGRRNEQLKFFEEKLKVSPSRSPSRRPWPRRRPGCDATFFSRRLTSFAPAVMRISHRTLISRKIITSTKSPTENDFWVDIEVDLL